MNILFISQLYPLSKDSKDSFALHYFVKEWIKNHNVQVIRPYLPMEKEDSPNTRKINIDQVSIDIVKPIWIPILKISIVKKSKILKLINEKPDIIICHLYNSYLTFAFLKKKFNIPLILGIHNSDIQLAKSPFQRLRIKRVIKKADAIAFRSKVLKKKFEELIPISHINNFIAYSGVPEDLMKIAKEKIDAQFKKNDVIKVLSVSSLIKRKQIDKVIIALNNLIDKNIKWEYTIVGEGPQKQELINMIAKFKLNGHIKFAGHISRNEVFQEMQKHNIFILPSYNETFGLVYLEAMANGCIVIGSKGWGIDGIIKNGENGFLCDPYDQENINICLKDILSLNESELNKIIKRSLGTVVDFSDEKMAKYYFYEITKLMQG